jgi:hypothetical protein
MPERAVLTEEMTEYLVNLRDSGITNMWGSPDYLGKRFELSDKDASTAVGEWMDSF